MSGVSESAFEKAFQNSLGLMAAGFIGKGAEAAVNKVSSCFSNKQKEEEEQKVAKKIEDFRKEQEKIIQQQREAEEQRIAEKKRTEEEKKPLIRAQAGIEIGGFKAGGGCAYQ